MIEIIEPGPLATVQDLGRPGVRALAVPSSGAFDRSSLALANRLVGNDPTAAGIEVTLGGLALRVLDAVTLACTGAYCRGAPDWGTPVTLPAGATVRLGVPADGLRSYIAVRGGLLPDAVLGSRSTDLLSGIGPPRLRAGDRLPVGPPSGEVSAAVGAGHPLGPAVLPVRLGPRDDWFTEAAVTQLLTATWTVRPDSDRVGIRLDGPVLDRAVTGELPSEPMLPGALQVPGDGRPIVFGPDAPVTGGYPVIAVLRTAAGLDRAGQLRPGETLTFRR